MEERSNKHDIDLYCALMRFAKSKFEVKPIMKFNFYEDLKTTLDSFIIIALFSAINCKN